MKKSIQFKSVILITTMLLICGSSAMQAQSESFQKQAEDHQKTLSPYFVVLSQNPLGDMLPLKLTKVNVNIAGTIADVKITQQYMNMGTTNLEAIYVFPLSTRAAVYSMTMKIGERTITALIREKEDARKLYQKALEQGNRVSLLEQNRPNLFTMKVGNIAPGEAISIELKYAELIIPENGVYEFVYPTVAGPRYISKAEAGKNNQEDFTNTPYTKQGVPATFKTEFEMKIKAGMPVELVTSKSHKIITTTTADQSALVKLSSSEINPGNRDIIIHYHLQGNQIKTGLMLYEKNDEKYFLLMMQPPKRVAVNEIPPREYIFIVDVSGSMMGFPLKISKELLTNLISSLKPTDYFNIVLFAGNSGTLSNSSLPANEVNIRKALELIDNQYGGGGTELLKAIKTAQNIPVPDVNISRSYVLLSDGYVNVESEAIQLIRSSEFRANFFSFGIGTSVNRYLMEALAWSGNGEAMITSNPNEADVVSQKFRSYIQTPVLSNIKIDFGDMEAYDTEPARISDLMVERPIVISGKYRGNATGKIKISGNSGNGKFEKTIPVFQYKPDSSLNELAILWAKERIRMLEYNISPEIMHNRNKDRDIKTAIIQLGLKHNLLTAYTSFIAVDKDFRVDKNNKTVLVKQPLPLPEGVENSAISISTEDNVDKEIIVYSGIAASVVEEDSDLPFVVVESMPQFPGGDMALHQFIGNNLIYPVKAQESGIQGRVILQFEIDEKGEIHNIVVVRSISKELDEEAIRILKSMPKWIPGKQRGKAVKVKYTLPISFRLK